LRIAVPQFTGLNLIKDAQSGVPHLEVAYEHWRSKSAKQQEHQFSDGTLRLIGFLWALLDGQTLMLMEEPELYLHTAIVRQLPEFIYKFQKRKGGRYRQIILSTHSYDLLSGEGLSPEEVVMLMPSTEGTILKKVSELEELQPLLQAGMSIAEAVTPNTAPKGIEQLGLWEDVGEPNNQKTTKPSKGKKT